MRATHQHDVQPMPPDQAMNTFITEARRQDLINQYMDCHEETGGEDSEGLRICLNCLSNPELIKYCQDSGWDIL